MNMATTVRTVSFSLRKTKILSNIENIGAAATIGTMVTSWPRKRPVFRQMTAVLKQKPEAINQIKPLFRH